MEGQTELYPAYLEAARQVEEMAENDPEAYLSVEWLEGIFRLKYNHRDFGFAMLNLKAVLAKSQIELWPIRPVSENGYKIANDSEKVALARAHLRRSASALHCQTRSLLNVESPSELTDKDRRSYEHQLKRNAFLRAAYSQSRTRKRLEELRANLLPGGDAAEE